MLYRYIKIINEGEDYITVSYAGIEYDIEGVARFIIKALLKRISQKK